MGHLANAKDEIYRALAERLNKHPVGAPVNEILMDILFRLYTESEALVGSKFPLLPMTLDKIAGITGIREEELKQILNGMADKGLVMDIPRKESIYYMLAPMVVGFFEYTFMRVNKDVNLKELAELFEKYFKSDGVGEEFSGTDTKMMRALVYESLIPVAVETEVLDHERASEIIRQSGGGAISMCACRHKASHLGKACGAPVEVCTSLGSAAKWVVRRGFGKEATVEELLNVLDHTEKLGLVHLCDNILNKPTYLCHCCGCCCQSLRSINELGKPFTHPSNFIPELDPAGCVGCGACASSCHIRAITMTDSGNETEVPGVNQEICIGCGACASACPSGSLTMARRSVLHLPPNNAKEKFIRIAMEKNRF
ncbi:MAG: (Fe-S)-binding protein [Peptococcaceae bacterium BRH_c4a]|nr:MAG: (Fe-S)-binding protein [Peptococcaceae bacterium BRH_c4a]